MRWSEDGGRRRHDHSVMPSEMVLVGETRGAAARFVERSLQSEEKLARQGGSTLPRRHPRSGYKIAPNSLVVWTQASDVPSYPSLETQYTMHQLSIFVHNVPTEPSRRSWATGKTRRNTWSGVAMVRTARMSRAAPKEEGSTAAKADNLPATTASGSFKRVLEPAKLNDVPAEAVANHYEGAPFANQV